VPEAAAISNTGPLIALAKVQRLGLLTLLFGEILIPKAVAAELTAGPGFLAGSDILTTRGFRVVECQRETGGLLRAELDLGEASVIQLARENPLAEVLIDEKKARRLAESVYGLRLLGTGGLLLRAKRRRLIAEVKPLFEQMRKNGYFVSDRLVGGILRAAAED
jgi:uncharacterized protein